MTIQKDHLKDKLKTIPELPGIYKMFNSKGTIIYIGKSKCLKKRVKSYFTGTHKWDKINNLVSLICDIEYTITETHLEARLLECELIKYYKPVFNSQLKNDQRYVYLKITGNFSQNPLAIVSEREEYTLGPYRSKYKLKDSIDILQNLFPITKIENKYQCEYHLLPQTLDKETLQLNRLALMDLFSDKKCLASYIKEAELKMKEAADLYKYETASKYLEVIKSLQYIKNGIDRYEKLQKSKILLNIPTTCGCKLFYIIGGKIILSGSFAEPTSAQVNEFINNGNLLLSAAKKSGKPGFAPLNVLEVQEDSSYEKMSMDFQDILYSEILSLPKDMVTFLKRKSQK